MYLLSTVFRQLPRSLNPICQSVIIKDSSDCKRWWRLLSMAEARGSIHRQLCSQQFLPVLHGSHQENLQIPPATVAPSTQGTHRSQ